MNNIFGDSKLFGHDDGNSGSYAMFSDELSTEYGDCKTAFVGTAQLNAGIYHGKKSSDGKTYFWYHSLNDEGQCNSPYYRYTFIAIG